MIEESLLGQSKFVGRDGFRWWIGQVAPRKDQADQTDDGKGWGNRYKVRIMGYHPFTDDVTDEDLPWAIALLPCTSGSGAANYATSTMLQQGDVVFGFFLDGDEGQVPAIIGHFSRTAGIDLDSDFEGKFKTGSAFTDNTPINPKTEVKDSGKPDQTSEQNSKANPTNSSATKGKNVDQSGAGTPIVAPDTCTTNSVSRMAQAVEDLANRVEDLSLTGMKLEAEIDAVADQVESMANGFVGRMMDATYDFLEPQLQKGLDKVYEDTFGKVFAQMGNSPQSYAMAHASGVASQVSQVPAIKNAENALSCVGNKVVEGLRGTVSDMLKDLLASGLGIAGCVTTNFAANFLNGITNKIADGLKNPLANLGNILAPGLDIADLLKGTALALDDFSGFLDCGQTNKDKCPPIRKYEVSGGPMEKGADPFAYVSYAMNKQSKGGGVKGAVSGLAGGVSGLAGSIDNISGAIGGITDTVQGITGALKNPGGLVGGLVKSQFGNLIPSGITNSLGSVGRISGLIDDLSGGGSCTGGKQNCGNPTMQIFGGGGIGAIGKVVLGKFIDKTAGLRSLTDSVSRTASIIGVDIKVPGRNYKSPPAISFADKCGKGYGAHGEAIINEDGEVIGAIITSVGEGYPIVDDDGIDNNVGITTMYVEDPGTGYTPGDKIDETVFVYDQGLPNSDGGRGTQTGISTEIVRTDPTTGEKLPSDVPDPYMDLIEPGKRITVSNLKDRQTFELVIDPATGGINAVKVLNSLKFETAPVLRIITSTGSGAVIRPIFGTLPERQGEVLTVVDCVG